MQISKSARSSYSFLIYSRNDLFLHSRSNCLLDKALLLSIAFAI